MYNRGASYNPDFSLNVDLKISKNREKVREKRCIPEMRIARILDDVRTDSQR